MSKDIDENSFDPQKLKIKLEIEKPFPYNGEIVTAILIYDGKEISKDEIKLPYIP